MFNKCQEHCVSGVLCTLVGLAVVLLNFMMPERIKEAFSTGVDSYEDEGAVHEEGFLNSVFLDGVTISPLTLKPTAAVSQFHTKFGAVKQF